MKGDLRLSLTSTYHGCHAFQETSYDCDEVGSRSYGTDTWNDYGEAVLTETVYSDHVYICKQGQTPAQEPVCATLYYSFPVIDGKRNVQCTR